MHQPDEQMRIEEIAGVALLVSQREQLVRFQSRGIEPRLHDAHLTHAAQHHELLGAVRDVREKLAGARKSLLHFGRGITFGGDLDATQRRIQLELLAVALAAVLAGLRQPEPFFDVTQGLEVRRALRSQVARPLPILHRLRIQRRLGVVMCQQFRVGARGLRELLLQRAGDFAVQVLPRTLQQRVARDVLQQGVLEHVNRAQRTFADGCQPGIAQAAQGPVHVGPGQGRDSADQLVAEFAPDDGADLSDGLCRGQAVQPRHQAVAQGSRDGNVGPSRRATCGLASRCRRFEDGRGELFDEQRDAVRAVEDALVKVFRQLSAIGYARHDRGALGAS